MDSELQLELANTVRLLERTPDLNVESIEPRREWQDQRHLIFRTDNDLSRAKRASNSEVRTSFGWQVEALYLAVQTPPNCLVVYARCKPCLRLHLLLELPCLEHQVCRFQPVIPQRGEYQNGEETSETPFTALVTHAHASRPTIVTVLPPQCRSRASPMPIHAHVPDRAAGILRQPECWCVPKALCPLAGRKSPRSAISVHVDGLH